MPLPVRAKKHLGQHFLTDAATAQRIVDSLKATDVHNVLEVGAGTGALTQFLLQRTDIQLFAVDADVESVAFLSKKFPTLTPNLFHNNFLQMDFRSYLPEKFCIIGNFPYNISSQILFKVLQHKDCIPEVVGMLQKEVAERIAAPSGSRTYGILSVLLQAFYSIEYLFTVEPNVFVPPPKVKSGVIRLLRNDTAHLLCNEQLFVRVVKTAFNQRRKTLHNSLKPLIGNLQTALPMMDLRPEQLSVGNFVELTNAVEPYILANGVASNPQKLPSKNL
jgi:16S rRNA (adenine1518-N6/adenine1519-N6)-dimethyltransferase